MKKAFVYLAEGFEEIEALTIVDVLRRAEIPTIMISVTGKLEVNGAHNITIIADILFEKADYDGASILILPGGMPGAKNLNAHEGLKKKLKEFHEQGERVAAICAAPLVLGGIGILEGVEAACYPGYEDRLTGAKLRYDPAVKSGKIITSRGPGTALDFSLTIVEELKGKEAADQLARNLLVQTW
jgi:4-methyl-5(b-hydroxyethyl)-thiazole monophosphate biosynthesis